MNRSYNDNNFLAMTSELESKGMKFDTKELRVYKLDNGTDAVGVQFGDGTVTGMMFNFYTEEYGDSANIYYQINPKTKDYESKIYSPSGESVYSYNYTKEYMDVFDNPEKYPDLYTANTNGTKSSGTGVNCDGLWDLVSGLGCLKACSYFVLPSAVTTCSILCLLSSIAMADCICNGNCGSTPMPPLECGSIYQPECE